MKIDASKKWCADAAKKEDGDEIGAGVLAIDPMTTETDGVDLDGWRELDDVPVAWREGHTVEGQLTSPDGKQGVILVEWQGGVGEHGLNLKPKE